jgi:hypothetical protein
MRDPTDVPLNDRHSSRGQGMMLAGIDPRESKFEFAWQREKEAISGQSEARTRSEQEIHHRAHGEHRDHLKIYDCLTSVCSVISVVNF